MHEISRTHLEKCRPNETGATRHIWSCGITLSLRSWPKARGRSPCGRCRGGQSRVKAEGWQKHSTRIHNQVGVSPRFQIHCLIQILRNFLSNSDSKYLEFYQPGEQWFPERHEFGHIYTLLSKPGVTVLCFCIQRCVHQFACL